MLLPENIAKESSSASTRTSDAAASESAPTLAKKPRLASPIVHTPGTLALSDLVDRTLASLYTPPALALIFKNISYFERRLMNMLDQRFPPMADVLLVRTVTME